MWKQYSYLRSLCVKKDSCIGTVCQGNGRSILTRSPPFSDLFWFQVNRTQQSVIFSIPDHFVIQVHCIGTSYQERHGAYSSWSFNHLWGTVLRYSYEHLRGTACARAELFTASWSNLCFTNKIDIRREHSCVLVDEWTRVKEWAEWMKDGKQTVWYSHNILRCTVKDYNILLLRDEVILHTKFTL